jgi:hypothetical protein
VLERQFEPSTASLPDGRQLELRACEEEGAAVGAVEPAELVLEVIAPTREEALDHAAPFLRRAVRELAFDLQQPLAIVRVEVAAPNEREPFVIYGFPLEPFGVGFRPWAPAVYAPTRRTRLRDYEEQSERVERALHWYVQALDTRLLLDRFLSLWIALQALAASAEKVVEPELLRCRHFVRFCPECGAETDQPRFGASIRQYLVRERGFSEDDARDAWRLRHMFHGRSVDLSESKVASLVDQLRGSVATALKAETGRAAGELPEIALMRGPWVTSIGLQFADVEVPESG